ncbi:hypothetical protein BGZ92_011788, partial [Podila epicladia]
MSLDDAVDLVRSIADAMTDGDMILIGIDGWNSEKRIKAAYELADKFVLNTLMNANNILGQVVFDKKVFEFSTEFNHKQG